MTDDGSGHLVSIPSFLLTKHASDAFKTAYEKGFPIIIKIDLETAPV